MRQIGLQWFGHVRRDRRWNAEEDGEGDGGTQKETSFMEDQEQGEEH